MATIVPMIMQIVLIVSVLTFIVANRERNKDMRELAALIKELLALLKKNSAGSGCSAGGASNFDTENKD
jgi:hypothetical protein